MIASENYVNGPWRYERFWGVGHCIPPGAPHALNALLLKFLEECHSDKAIASG